MYLYTHLFYCIDLLGESTSSTITIVKYLRQSVPHGECCHTARHLQSHDALGQCRLVHWPKVHQDDGDDRQVGRGFDSACLWVPLDVAQTKCLEQAQDKPCA